MKYAKQSGGEWVKAADIKSGTKCKLVAETVPTPSKFTEGKFDNVSKLRLQGVEAAKNVRINGASLNALIDAFGDDSKDWQGHVLTAVTERIAVAGKRVTALYLVPDGYAVSEDDEGYIQIIKEGAGGGVMTAPTGSVSLGAVQSAIMNDDISDAIPF